MRHYLITGGTILAKDGTKLALKNTFGGSDIETKSGKAK